MTKIEFSKNNTLALKGIAIIMMIFHHCFRSTKLFNGYTISFFSFNQEFIVNISGVFKICVIIFAFITGYGLCLSLKKLNENYKWTNKEIYKWIVNRIIKTLAVFWIIALLSYIICQIINRKTIDVFFYNGIGQGIINICINFLGLSNLFGLKGFNSAW